MPLPAWKPDVKAWRKRFGILAAQVGFLAASAVGLLTLVGGWQPSVGGLELSIELIMTGTWALTYGTVLVGAGTLSSASSGIDSQVRQVRAARRRPVGQAASAAADAALEGLGLPRSIPYDGAHVDTGRRLDDHSSSGSTAMARVGGVGTRRLPGGSSYELVRSRSGDLILSAPVPLGDIRVVAVEEGTLDLEAVDRDLDAPAWDAATLVWGGGDDLDEWLTPTVRALALPLLLEGLELSNGVLSGPLIDDSLGSLGRTLALVDALAAHVRALRRYTPAERAMAALRGADSHAARRRIVARLARQRSDADSRVALETWARTGEGRSRVQAVAALAKPALAVVLFEDSTALPEVRAGGLAIWLDTDLHAARRALDDLSPPAALPIARALVEGDLSAEHQPALHAEFTAKVVALTSAARQWHGHLSMSDRAHGGELSHAEESEGALSVEPAEA